MNPIRLSYVVTTFNKLSYLKLTMERLIANVGEDEEVVVTDGGSKDGTADYLKGLFEQGKIQYYVSEPDRGEGHGFNRAIMASRGELIKVITDDDLFNYPAIRECRDFMLSHPEYDILSGSGIYGHFVPEYYSYKIAFNDEYRFRQWLNDRKPFIAGGLALMIRRSSLSLLGLFRPDVIANDAEYMLRITSMKMKMAWYTGFVFMSMLNQSSGSYTKKDRIQQEIYNLSFYYQLYEQKSKKQLIIFLLKKLYGLRGFSWGSPFKKNKLNYDKEMRYPHQGQDISDVFLEFDQILAKESKQIKPEIIG